MSTDSSFEDNRYDNTGYQTSPPGASSLDVESHKSPESLEREIDAQRSSIGSLVDALESKLSPGQLIDQVMSFTRGNGGEFFSNLGNTIKANPVPTLLTSVGVVWLLMGSNKSPSYSNASSGPSMFDALGNRISNMADKVSDTLGNVKAKVQDKAHDLQDGASRLKDKASHLTDSVTDKMSSAGHQVNMGSHDATHALHQQSENIKSGFNYLLNEQPLALAAIGIALGALAGAALPITDKENQMMGHASDSLTDKAKQMASEGYDKAAEIGKDMANEVKKPVEDNDKDASSNGASSDHQAFSSQQPPNNQSTDTPQSNNSHSNPGSTHGLG
ncbi:DUF3618 domain-containing protein [Pseudomonas sp. 10B1]|uniref:DUF3618 domain-containing protein n=1 Tax=unclassified Pseudomonas TaxID=196821 RepID=UPI002AB5692D|nr:MULTISPECIES: DUF3618 domain-containing protein [unclassified Pseudomonas]MDY7560964.1 DUF3618 domain-containing protein [Pseudomonas sp. AB6]MEA9978293.1 DUF3618 domain-containing protein [Pseudomonas sp. RTS4]MEA9995108.1 DUF3618 domain-containing protein [Pseudomonas sp. AA4]MEB0086958.1 DUF3618 domain-containing protein [Pseudomonas sp. RTI1]MEB0126775.1 DUF3618 domain-containing protein [Pseudomonas sp. CCC1.2]